VTLDFLRQNGMNVSYQEVGGSINRTVHLDISTGSVGLKTPLGNGSFSLAS
jgi:chemotaxis protein CheD